MSDIDNTAAYSSARFRSYHSFENGLPERFAIVTAYNPQGKKIDDALNECLDIELVDALRLANIVHWRVIGGDKNFVHAEPGYGIVSSIDIAISIGQRFNQEAIFWVDKSDLFLVDCIRCNPVLIGSWFERQDANANDSLRTIIEKGQYSPPSLRAKRGNPD